MDLSDIESFLSVFLDSLSSVGSWFITMFSDYSPFNHPLVFTITAVIIIGIVIEEFFGLLTSFRFGGFLIRPFYFRLRPNYSNDIGLQIRDKGFIKEYGKEKFYLSYEGRILRGYKPSKIPSIRTSYENKLSSKGISVIRSDSVKSLGLSSSTSSSNGYKTGSTKGITGKLFSKPISRVGRILKRKYGDDIRSALSGDSNSDDSSDPEQQSED